MVNLVENWRYAGPMLSLVDAALATVQTTLDPSVFAEAFAAGQPMSLAEAFATMLPPFQAADGLSVLAPKEYAS